MGSGSYSFAVYASLASDRGYATKSADAVFTNHSLSAKSDIKLSNVDARTYNTQIKPEMVDTGVTGSMRRTPHEMIKDNFPKLMDALMQLGIKDPQLLFMAVGDHEYDNYPIQVGQFESDTEKIVNSLEEFVLEGGGGGNAGESYLLAHIIAGYHTETDSWFKRHKKGYLFTIGDEPNLRNISGRALETFLGYQHPANPISADEAVKKAQEQYNVYHIHVTNGSYGTRIAPGWKDLLGQNVLTCDSHNIHNVIAEAIRQHEDLTGIPYEATAVAPTSTGKESGTYTY